MSLLEDMRASILFDASRAETLNESISRVDPRLFWFAYYRPAPWPDENNWQLLFYLTILNAYSLIWDCGPHPIYTICLLYSRPDSRAYKDTKNFCHLIKAFRTYLAHSCSEELYFNKKMHEIIRSFVEKKQAEASQGFSASWENRCKIILEGVVQLGNFLIRVSEFVAKDGTDKWLKALAEYYQRNDHYLLHVLADRYALRLMDQHRKSGNFNEKKVKDWIRNSYSFDVASSGGDGYEKYWEKCRCRVSLKLKARDCPKPALPLPFFRSITCDAQKFIIL